MMLKSSLKTPSSIDHDLFPLLTVRSCVSEADESKNGPRFCAEDKMTGAAYEVRSRKLVLAREVNPDARMNATQEEEGQLPLLLSSSNLQVIRRQRARIDALLSAAASSTVPPSVALPIDVYIQEQPSTGDTFVASVEAFAGLSLGDIIRSGWGMMEEQAFLEILNAVESYGYASASLPPHGNLSSDAIKQLLIVRDGASEARQPSRWVVSDWLLLSDDSVCVAAAAEAFDVEAFIGDLEWTLHSSFAQLRISTSADGAYLAAAQVEDAINETVERIRLFLTQQAAEKAAAVAASSPDEGVSQEAAVAASVNGTPPNVVQSVSDNDGVAATASADHAGSDNANVTVGGAASSSLAASSPASYAQADLPTEPVSLAATATTTSPRKVSDTSKGYGNGVRRGQNSPRQLHDDANNTTRTMTLKDKMAYHQAALRNEQMLLNKQRRKNAPLPPRPTSAANPAYRAAFTSKFPADDEDVYYDVPTLGLPIQVKPSAFLMQGRRTSATGGPRSTGSSARKQQSPRSTHGPNSSDCRTPCDGSRSTTTTTAAPSPETKPSSGQRRQQQQQQRVSTPRKPPTTPRDLRERLLDDVVNMAVMNRSRRGQYLRQQQEEDRKRRELRQHVLAQKTSPRLVKAAAARGQHQHTIPAVLEQPRFTGAATASWSNASAAVPAATTYEQQRGIIGRRSGAVLTTHNNNNNNNTAAAAASCHSNVTTAAVGTGNADAPSGGQAASSFMQADDWPTNLSESPEPIPPSPFARPVMQTYTAPTKAAGVLPHYRTPLGTPRGRGGAAAGAATATPQVNRDRLGVRSGRVLCPTVGRRLQRTGVNAARTGGLVREVAPSTPTKTGCNPLRSARGVAAAAPRSTALRVAGTKAGVSAGHPLSARGRRQLAAAAASAAAAAPAELPVKEEEQQPQPARSVSSSSQQQPQHPTSSSEPPMPYVKPLPLAMLGLRRNSASGSPHAPTAAGGTHNREAYDNAHHSSDLNMKSLHGAEMSLSNTLNATKSSGGSARRLALPVSPRAAAAGLTTLPPSSNRGSPRAPNTARPVPPQPALSPRGYRRVLSTGVLQSRAAATAAGGKSGVRSGARVRSSQLHTTAPSRTPQNGGRETPGTATAEDDAAGGDVAIAGKAAVVTHNPRLVPRKAVDVDGGKVLAAVNRKPMRWLVPEKVRASHAAAGEVQETPRTASGVGLGTPRNRPTSNLRTGGGEKQQQTSPGAARRKSTLTLGNVRPVNETSPGILLRHHRRATA